LNWNHNHEAEESVQGGSHNGQLFQWGVSRVLSWAAQENMQPEMARLTLARKIAAITLKIWKKEKRSTRNL